MAIVSLVYFLPVWQPCP